MVLNTGNQEATEAFLKIKKGASDVTVTVIVTSNPPSDPGHSVQKAWKLTVASGSLNGARVTASGTDSPSFYIGCDPTIPVPDTSGWDDLATTPTNPVVPGMRTAVLPNPACNPSYLVLVT